VVRNAAFALALAGTLFGDWTGDMAADLSELSAVGWGQLPES
jgi:hypothetical protein